MPVIRGDFGHLCFHWYCHFPTGYLYGNQLRIASGVLMRFDRIFGGKPTHNQRQLTISSHLNRCLINALHVLCGESTTSIHPHNEFSVVHDFSLLSLSAIETRRRASLE
jgi:hypothetical protein